MSINLSIKGVPEPLAERLRARAERNHRSLQGELMVIVCAAAHDTPPAPAKQAEQAEPIASSSGLQGWKTIEQLLAERRAGGWAAPAFAAAAPLGVDIVRADRDSR